MLNENIKFINNRYESNSRCRAAEDRRLLGCDWVINQSAHKVWKFRCSYEEPGLLNLEKICDCLKQINFRSKIL